MVHQTSAVRAVDQAAQPVGIGARGRVVDIMSSHTVCLFPQLGGNNGLVGFWEDHPLAFVRGDSLLTPETGPDRFAQDKRSHVFGPVQDRQDV